jgi:AcrR family transcriptional regulator
MDRLVTAALACVEEGQAADLAAVAARVGVTRQTVYRYFPSRQALFQAAAYRLAGVLVEQVADHLAGVTDAEDGVVEVVFFCLRSLPVDPRLSFIVRPGSDVALIMSPQGPALAARILTELPIGLDHLSEGERADLAEHMVRLLQALLLDPSTATRDDADVRRFLHVCLGPSVHPPTIRR